MSGPNPACEKKRLHIEVTGTGHGPEHQIRFYDIGDRERKSGIEATKQTLELEDTTIYDWDWTGESANNAKLAIETESGPTIELPLFEIITETKRKVNQDQELQLHACLPSLILQNADQQYRERYVAPPRGGYIYITYRTSYSGPMRIWREIEITPTAEGVEYRDVNLNAYREGKDGPMPCSDEKREATGKPLKEIWLPSKRHGSSLNSKIMVAYSEVPWSMHRIRYLEDEKNRGHFRERMSRYKPVSVNSLDPARPRQLETELMLAKVTDFNRDLQGQEVSALFKKLKEEQQILASDSGDASHAFGDLRGRFEFAMRDTACCATNDLSDPVMEESDWEIDGVEDFWKEAKSRHLRTFSCDDPIFLLRNHHSLITTAVAYFERIRELSAKKPHYQSAELIARTVLADELNGERNPLNEHKKEMDLSPNGVFHRTLRTAERSHFRMQLPKMQTAIDRCIRQKLTVAAIRDFNAQTDDACMQGHALMGNVIAAMVVNADKMDTTVAPEAREKDKSLAAVAKLFDPQGRHPMHPALFPVMAKEGDKEDSDNLQQDPLLVDTYLPPAPVNDGSGLATEKNLARWNETNIDLDSTVESLDVGLATVMSLEFAASNGRRSIGYFDGLLRGYTDALLKMMTDQKALADSTGEIRFDRIRASGLRSYKILMNESLKELKYDSLTESGSGKRIVLGIEDSEMKWGLTDAERGNYHQSRHGQMELYDHRTKSTVNLNTHADRLRSLGDMDSPSLKTIKGLKLIYMDSDKLSPEKQLMFSRGMRAKDIYSSWRVPYLVMVFEMMNLSNSIIKAKQDHYFYSGASAISAVLDLFVASCNIANFYQKKWNLLKSLNVEYRISEGVVKLLTFRGTELLKRSVSKLAFLGLFASVITGLLAFWDSIRLFGKNDHDAAIATAIFATGTIVTGVIGNAFKLSLLGVVGLILFAVAIGAIITAEFLKDSPLEEWLKNGPFTKYSVGHDYQDLKNDAEFSWYQLLNTLLSLRATIKPLKKSGLSEAEYQLLKTRGVDYQIEVGSNMGALLVDSDAKPVYKLVTREVDMKISHSGGSMFGDFRPASGNEVQPVFTKKIQGGCIEYFSSSNRDVAFGTPNRVTTSQYTEIACALQLKVDDKFFPAPSMDSGSQAIGRMSQVPKVPLKEQDGWILGEYETV